MFSIIIGTASCNFTFTTGVQLKFLSETENEVAILMISNVSIAMSGSYRCQSTFHGSENSVQLMSNPFSINILSKFQLLATFRNVATGLSADYKILFCINVEQVDWSEKIHQHKGQELKGILTPASTSADNYRVVPVSSDVSISCTFGTSGYLSYYQWRWEQFDDNPEYTSQVRNSFELIILQYFYLETSLV